MLRSVLTRQRALTAALSTAHHHTGNRGAAIKRRLAQAVALAPIGWAGPAEPFGPLSFDAATGMLAVPVRDPAVDPASILADAGTAGPLFGAPQKSPEPNLVLLPLLGPSSGTDLTGATVELTFTTAEGPFSVAKRIGAGSTAAGQ